MSRYKKVKAIYKRMQKLVDDPHTEFADKWDDFWVMSQEVVLIADISWYDPDTSYEEDIMSRYTAIGDWLDERR